MHSQIMIIQVCVKNPILVIRRAVFDISQFARLYVKLHEFKQSGFPAIPTYKETFTREALMFQNYDRANSNAFIINLVFSSTLCAEQSFIFGFSQYLVNLSDNVSI